MKRKHRHDLPKGWTLRDVQTIADHYDNQTEEESAAEIERAGEADAVVIVPRALLPRVRKLLDQDAAKAKNGKKWRPRKATTRA